MQFSPTSCHFIPLRSKYSQHPVITIIIIIIIIITLCNKISSNKSLLTQLALICTNTCTTAQHADPYLTLTAAALWALQSMMNLGLCVTVSLSCRQSVGLLGRGTSLSQGRYLHRTTQTQTSCLEWNSKSRNHCLSGRRRFMPWTPRPL
jgi:hypothetical protein